MKIRKKELKNIINNGWAERRARSTVNSLKNSERTKNWKNRVLKARRLLATLEKSENLQDQADAMVIKQLLEMISYDF